MTTPDDTGRLGLAMLIVLCVVAMRAFDQIDGAQFTPFSRLGGKVRRRWFPRITLTVQPQQRFV